jgi:hypothetical protein
MTLSNMYVYDAAGEPIPCDDVLTWGRFFESHERSLLRDVRGHRGRVVVSTVFLGLDHNFFGEGPPVLWETMIFGGVFDSYQRRYRSKLDALAGHLRALGLVERYATAPRRLKKAMQKVQDGRPLGHVEKRRIVPIFHDT